MKNLKKMMLTLVIAFAIVSFWRGVWGLMDLYLFPDNLLVSFAVSIMAGIVIIYLIKHRLKSLI